MIYERSELRRQLDGVFGYPALSFLCDVDGASVEVL